MKLFPFIEAEEEEQRNVSKSCILLEVSRSAYYAWAAHCPSAQELSNTALGEPVPRDPALRGLQRVCPQGRPGRMLPLLRRARCSRRHH